MTPATAQGAADERILFLHIGLPKCGSTTIQAALVRMAPALERRGIHVLVAGRNRQGSHSPLKRALAEPELAASRWELGAAATEIAASAARRFVVTAESLTSISPDHAEWPERVRAWAERAGVSVRVVAYVRPQWELVEATYSQLVKRGSVGWSFDRWLPGETPLGPGTALRLDYGRRLRPWRHVFGGESLVVRPLDRAAGGTGLVAHFLRVVGVDDARLLEAASAAPRRNTRPGAKYLEVRRRARRFAGRKSLARGLALQGAAALIRGDRPFAGLAAEDIAALQARFEEANASFAREFGIDAGGALFRTPLPTARPVHAPAWSEFGWFERRLLRHYVRQSTGIDIDPAVGSDMRPSGGNGA